MKTHHKYALNQITQCALEPIAVESTKAIATFYSKYSATILSGYKLTGSFSGEVLICYQISNGNRPD